jgi:cyclic beta-1,2-glucan synthetase
MGLAFILFGFLAGVVSIGLYRPEPILNGGLAALVPILGGGLAGSLLAWGWIRRSRYGVERRLLKEHAHWLVSEETVLILQAPLETLRFAVAVLQESGEIPPAIFSLPPRHEGLSGEVRSPGVPLSLAQMQEHAQRLATSHQVSSKPRRNAELVEQLERARQWIHQVCLELAEASRLAQSTPPIAEWILDNEHIIESTAYDVELNLPRRYYQELPALANEPYLGLPRIYGLAKELISHTDLRLDRENILAYIAAYQSVRTLTIGELWAVPQMLRIALVESIQYLAGTALTELREREIANFWANRLIAAGRRDPNQLFSILADLVSAQPNPSLYFAFQLVDHLYDEEAALVPVQSWLERTYRKPLREISLQEQNRQTKGQISIGNAFTTLRQLSLLDWREIFEQLSRVEQVLRLDPASVYPKMDFDTRDRYRRAIEAFARGAGQGEDLVARRAIELAAQAARGATQDERRVHVGTYLIGEGRREFARLIHGHETPRFYVLQWVYRHHFAVYFYGFALFSAVFIALIVLLGLGGQTPGIPLLITLLLIIPVSQLALEVLNYLVTRLLPPRTLPKMAFLTRFAR